MGRVRKEKSRSEKIREEKESEARRFAFSNDLGSGGSKSRLAKAAGAEPAKLRCRKKVHAVVARSTFPSQKC